MPRPRKCRKVCRMPVIREFHPVGETPCKAFVVMTVDEYEAIRLIDKQGFSQEECSSYMQVARTTVQMIYNAARKKLADALVEGLPLRIEGGEYQLCDGKEEYCGCGGCRRHRRGCMQENSKGDGKMKIAIPLDENRQDVCIVLARAPYFLFREEGSDSIVENPAAQAQGGAGVQVAQFLVDSGVNALVTVRCGQNAADVFKAADMQIYKSANKAAADDLAALERGELKELTEFHGGFHGGV
ncbi:MAG: DUF134 domain-containing protein [Eubacteriales bacterium]|nr:DUF134 domain-containing protein [Eubacteriales bacterium]